MSIVYLHIGTPKTGTSAIQAFLGMKKNQEALSNKGFAFPHFEDFRSEDDAVINRNAHTLIFGVYLNRTDYDKNAELREDFWKKVGGLLDEGKNVILSDESIWHVSLKIDNFFKNIYDRVKSMGHELRIVVYLRRQDKLLQSYWRYKVMIARRHTQSSFKKYLESGKYNYFPLDYFERLSQIAEVVGGEENVIVRAYEPGQFYGEEPTIISDFLHCLGIELTEDFKQPGIKRNEGIDFACCEVKRRLNAHEFVQNSDALRPYLVNISERNREEKRFQAPTLFTKKDLKEFMDRYEESNRRTAEVFMHRKDGVLFQEPVKYPEKNPESMMTEKDRMLICADVMEQMDQEIKRLKKELAETKKPTWKKAFRVAACRLRGKDSF